MAGELKACWLLACSCGWTREGLSRWATESEAKLHPELSAPGIAHTIAAGSGIALRGWSRSYTQVAQREPATQKHHQQWCEALDGELARARSISRGMR
jgi:hypothetical protein